MALGSKIRGITIEFNGDTSKLGKALKQIDSQTKSLDRDLTDVNKALKFNPKNTELLAQKQKLLGDKIEQTKERLTALKNAQAKLDDDPAVDKTSQDYMALRREIITTESKLEHFQKQLKETNNYKFDQLGKKFGEVGDKMQSVGKGMTKYVTGPIVGVGAASIKAFNEVKDGLNIVAQKTGATGQALADMQKQARELAKEIPTDFSTAGEAIGEVNTRFGLNGQALEDLSAKYVKFAKVNGTEVTSSVDATQKALSAFGLSAKDAGDLLDTLTKVGQNTGASVDSLTEGLIQNGTAFQELGLDIHQSAVLMGQMEKSGANSETVMQGLRKALKSAAAEGKPLDQALSDLQDTIKDGKGGVDGLTAAYDLFGKSGDQIYSAVKNGTLDFKDLALSADDAKGSLERTFEETLTPAEKFQTTMNTVKDSGYTIGNTIMEIVAPALEKLADKIEKAAEWWQNLSPGMQKFIVITAGVMAAIGPLLFGLGKIATGIRSIILVAPKLISGFGAIGKAFGVLKGILLANPWALVAAAAIAAIVLIVKNWDKIKDFMSKLWKNIKIVAKNAWEGIKNAVVAPIQAAVEIVKAAIDKIKSFFNFKVRLPKIKLPHFYISPKGWELGDLLEGVIPSLGIDWYAKGGIFKSPSVIGVGEAGPEAVLPIEKLEGMLMGMADSIVTGVATAMSLQSAGAGSEITIPIYLYPSGPKMGEETVRTYDRYKKILG